MDQSTRPVVPTDSLLHGYDIVVDPVYLFDEHHQLIYQNPAAELFSKSTPAPSSSQTPAELFSTSVAAAVTSALGTVTTHRQPLIFGTRDYSGQREILLRLSIIPIINDDSGISGVLCIINDLSSLETSSIPLQPSFSQETPAPQTEHQPDDEQKRFLTNMTHELRTPLNGVIGITELLCSTTLTKNQREYASIIQTSCNAILSIVNSLLDFSKMENGSLLTRCDQFSIVGAIFEEVQIIHEKTRVKGIETGVFIDKNVPPLCNGDSHHFRQIMRKLLDNAVKFTDKGSIFIEARLLGIKTSEPQIQICITDSGIGIPHDKQSKIFTPFFQVDNSAIRKYGGIGLGLVLSQRIVHLLGGQIHFYSTPDAGSSFTFSIPVNISGSHAAKPVPVSPAARVLCLGATFPTDKILYQYLADISITPDMCTPNDFPAYSSVLNEYDAILVDESVPDELLRHTPGNSKQKTPAPKYCLITAKPSNTLPEEPFSALLVKPFTRADLCTVVTKQSAEVQNSEHEM